MSDAAVLVVEDDADVLDIMCMALQDEGYRAIGASDGKDALAVMRSERLGLILLDLRMPGMSGPELRAEQLKDPALADIPVVILSADAAIEQLASSLKANGHLRKPISLAALLEVVEKYCPRA